ncbi:thioesterase II family protein [Nocardia alba]|uniref:Thioesterase TesA n=1 Tax=Nocardia alba TaxID=225051 RepID=A0A4R1FRU0_9NOCA|nr:alpha/beta fold hydrolase [Nocardia alba]TCJ96930.1 surfactin synthase thioesterase subunit [Nocardia alba]
MSADPAVRWLREFGAGAPELPVLVCLPHAGGTAGFFRPLSVTLARTHRVFAVQYPGRQDRFREPLIGDIESTAAALADALRTTVAGPFELLGHSMGALIGFEVARSLDTETATRVRHLTVTSARPPASPSPRPPLHELDDTQFLERITTLGGTESSIFDDPETRAMYLPSLRSDYRAVERYRAAESADVGCGITVIAGLRDPLVSAATAEGWRAHTRGRFRVRVLDTDHFGVHRTPARLATELSAERAFGRKTME